MSRSSMRTVTLVLSLPAWAWPAGATSTLRFFHAPNLAYTTAWLNLLMTAFVIPCPLNLEDPGNVIRSKD
jgi:hypothetical protein